MFHRVLVIGGGLIGGSVALALQRHTLAVDVRVYDPAYSAESLQQVGLTSAVLSDAATADLIVLAIPVCSIPDMVVQLNMYLTPQAILIDVASTKVSLIAALRQILAEKISHCVFAHPIAGKEHNGLLAAEAQLFENKAVVLTPVAETEAVKLAKVKALWQAMGAKVYTMTPEQHDRLYAQYSHWPNLLAFLLQAQQRESLSSELLPPSFQTMTRLARSSPSMWRDIALSNRDEILAAMAQFEKELHCLRTLLENADEEGLLTWLAEVNSRQ